ncbi:hypothetical protein ACVGVM_03170 [Pseudonocardia bannensis]|uniref:Uncharacterized protein n=1 Tax=Pseudonocardia bannensis TaxID=630973 RepID=A0A848DNW7_9PSEU|nr:hypothetical protein [Pseudonocardia bannensis]NMH94111.1 hypothetical protein [Pseudonocardia bannensis]
MSLHRTTGSGRARATPPLVRQVVVALGIVVATAAVIAGVVAGKAGDRSAAGFLLVGGLLTGLLILDDFLQSHESVYPALGVSEIYVYPAYALLFSGWAWRWRERLLDSDLVLLVLAGALFAVMILVDQVGTPFGWNSHIVEDGAKATGMAVLAAYLIRAGLRVVLIHSQGVRRPAPARHAAGR